MRDKNYYPYIIILIVLFMYILVIHPNIEASKKPISQIDEVSTTTTSVETTMTSNTTTTSTTTVTTTTTQINKIPLTVISTNYNELVKLVNTTTTTTTRQYNYLYDVESHVIHDVDCTYADESCMYKVFDNYIYSAIPCEICNPDIRIKVPYNGQDSMNY